MPPKYALYPGPVRSKVDGDTHQISAYMLTQLFKVDMRECLIVERGDECKPWRRGHILHAAQLIALRPKDNGNYTLPTS